MQVCLVIEKMFPEANLSNYGVTVFPDGHWEITKWELAVPQPTLDELQAQWDTLNLEILKQNKLNELDEACTNAILGRFKVTLNGTEYEFSYDDKAQSRFNGIGILFLGNKITENPWTAYLNGERVRLTLTKDDFNIVSIAAMNHENDNVIRYNQLLLEVDSATLDTINQISW